MKTIVLFLSLSVASATGLFAMSSETQEATQKGALASLALRIVDATTDQAVTGACVFVRYVVYGKPEYVCRGQTDSTGYFVSQNPCMGEVEWVIEKQGYYTTTGQDVLFQQNGGDCVRDGKWQPWKREIQVRLKRINRQIQGVIAEASLVVPKNMMVGYDCEKRDLVPPYGKGVVADLRLKYQSVFHLDLGRMSITNRLDMGAGPLGGFIVKERESFSKFEYCYLAPPSGYGDFFLRHAEPVDPKIEERALSKGQYLIFRSRVTTNSIGQVISCRYGTLESLECGESLRNGPEYGRIRFVYSWSTKDNDPSLEIVAPGPILHSARGCR